MGKFEIGETVIMHGYGNSRKLVKIDSITKAGNIKINDEVFRPDGHLRGGGVWSSSYIDKTNPEEIKEIKDEIYKENLIYFLRNFDLNTLSNTKLTEIYKIMKGAKK